MKIRNYIWKSDSFNPLITQGEHGGQVFLLYFLDAGLSWIAIAYAWTEICILVSFDS